MRGIVNGWKQTDSLIALLNGSKETCSLATGLLGTVQKGDRMNYGSEAAVLDGAAEKENNAAVQLADYDLMKQKLTMELVSADRNTEMLESVPHDRVEDMAVVYRFVLNEDGAGRETVLVTNDMLDQFGITAEQLKTDAQEIAPREFPATLRGLTEVIAEMSGMDADALLDGATETIFVASIGDGMHGAGVLAYPDFLKNAAEELNSDFFVLPSSIHEVLLVKDDGRLSGTELQHMVGDINAAEVAPEDQLTDHAYHYDSKANAFELVDDFEARKQAEREESLEQGEEKKSVLKDLQQKKTETHGREPDTGRAAPKAKGGEAL